MSGPIILSPPIDAGEVETLCFDYGLLLQDAPLTITAVASVTCTVVSGTDDTPSSRLIDFPIISASRETGEESAAVLQQVGTMVAGVVYLVTCTATISDGQSLKISARLACI